MTDPCCHDSCSGDEGPVIERGSRYVVRWRCDGCGEVVYSDAALASLRSEFLAVRAERDSARQQLADDRATNDRIGRAYAQQAIDDAAERDAALALVGQLQGQLDAVRALHHEHEFTDNRPRCCHCGQYAPCSTIRALAAAVLSDREGTQTEVAAVAPRPRRTIRVKPSQEPQVEAMLADPDAYFAGVRERADRNREGTK